MGRYIDKNIISFGFHTLKSREGCGCLSVQVGYFDRDFKVVLLFSKTMINRCVQNRVLKYFKHKKFIVLFLKKCMYNR